MNINLEVLLTPGVSLSTDSMIRLWGLRAPRYLLWRFSTFFNNSLYADHGGSINWNERKSKEKLHTESI
jgi:hypothetical protein